MEKYKLMMDFSNCLVVDCLGKSDGLALLWIIEVQVIIKNYSTNYIHATIVENNLDHSSWYFTKIYGFLEVSNKYKTWERLRMLNQQCQEKWLVCRNFNEVTFRDEKWILKQKVDNLLLDFLTMANNCELADMGFKGPKFT